MRIHCYPKESTISRIHNFRARLRTLENPLRVPGLRIDLVPPAQADKAAPGYVFYVVEIGGEEEDGDYED
jgi:hypothetical protein